MSETRLSDADRLRCRRWSFAASIFDEVSWSLTVSGKRVAVEHKPLELLRELLVHAGRVVSKNDLLRLIWPNVTVVEGSLPTAIYKLRVALRDDGRKRRIIETVPGIGYRLLVPVEVEEVPSSTITIATGGAPTVELAQEFEGARTTELARRSSSSFFRLSAIVAGAVIAAGGMTYTLTPSESVPATNGRRTFTQQEAMNALRRLDVGTVERMLAAGWDPNSEVRGEGNAALHYVVEMCEWNPGHDRDRMLLMVRTLVEGGARYDARNIWGDTPYSIAKAPRFCGPDHPVTRSMRATCFSGFRPLADRCLASYELNRRTGR